MLTRMIAAAISLTIFSTAWAAPPDEPIRVKDSDQLLRAMQTAKPGTTIELAPGTFRGGLSFREINGTAEAPIRIIGSRVPMGPTVFEGGNQAIHLADCNHIVLSHFGVADYPVNGINIDDGGSYDTPAEGITVENVSFYRIGPKGNHDALKLSGLKNFTVRGCSFAGWGGSGVDMVGCHDGTISTCSFRGLDGHSNSSGIQIKGGSTGITVERCQFENAGSRAINCGGSTGLQFFRPKVGDHEAKNITIAGNWFRGGEAAIAFPTSRNSHVHHNTFILPEKFLLRLLQETKDPRFLPSGEIRFEHNLVVYDGRVNPRLLLNIGSGTAPKTMTFRNNAWLNLSGNRRVQLPTEETNPVYQPQVKLSRGENKEILRVFPTPSIEGIGWEAYDAE